MSERRVFLVGEGRHELGGWHGDATWRPAKVDPCVLENLARSVVPDGWEVIGARPFKSYARLEVGTGDRARLADREAEAVKKASQEARREGATLLLVRDRDGGGGRPGDRDRRQGLLEEAARHPDHAVGLAVECIEAWVLAATGETGTEGRSKVQIQERCETKGYGTATAKAEACATPKIPADALSLRDWLEQVRRVLTT